MAIKNLLTGIIITASLIFFLSSLSYAGFHGLTHHSRANCFGFNESVTWWAGNPVAAYVVSTHYPYAKNGDTDTFHRLATPKLVSWRHPAFHTNESYAFGTYIVDGLHFMPDGGGRYILVWHSNSGDCSEYDGWWG